MGKPKTTSRDQIITLLTELLDNLDTNRNSIDIIGHILPDASIRWRCLYPMFPREHTIYQEFVRIGDPKKLRSKKTMNAWISEAMALTEHAISLIKTLNDNDIKSAGITIVSCANPPLEVKGRLVKFKKSSEIHLLLKIAEECERASIIDCNRACAFYIRKILEVSIKKKALIDGIPLRTSSHIVGLKGLINQYESQLGSLHSELLSRKFLLEETIHDDHNPAIQELKHSTDLVFRAIDKLKIFDELEEGVD